MRPASKKVVCQQLLPALPTISTCTVTSSSKSIFQVLLKEGSPKNPGQVKFIVIGKNGDYSVDPGDLPLSMTLELGSKYDASNQCGEQLFDGQAGICGHNGKAAICR